MKAPTTTGTEEVVLTQEQGMAFQSPGNDLCTLLATEGTT